MLKQQLTRMNRKFGCSLPKNPYIIGLILFCLVMVFVISNVLSRKWIFENFSSTYRTELIFSPKSAINLLLLYEQELSRAETSSFQPTFHNHRLAFKLNLTSMVKEHLDYFKKNSTKGIHHLKITCLKNVNNFHSICDIHLNFLLQTLNIKEMHLILLLKNATCPLSLTETGNMISIDIDQTFAVNDTFRFTYQWHGFDKKTKLLLWPEWPIKEQCLNWYLNNLPGNGNQYSVQCSLVSVLKHSTSRELFIKEQTAVSYWLDLQYKTSKLTNKSKNRRRLAPFEIAKNSSICSTEFQNWIHKYQQWHENISFIINNGSMTIEEQRNRIVELDIRFMIYEKQTSGIADRIIHLISTYFVALLTNRLFIFDKNWPDFFDITQGSLNYEQKLLIPWYSQLHFLNSNLSINDKNYLTFQTKHFSTDRYKKDYDYEKHFPERILLFKGHTGGVIRMIHSSSSIYRKFLTMDLKMNTSEIFGCLYHSLFTYRLSELIKRISSIPTNEQLGHTSQQILQTLLSSQFFPTGIQIRAGDQTMKETNTEQSKHSLDDNKNLESSMNFFTCAQDIMHENENTSDAFSQKRIAFVISDSLQIRQAALRRWQLPLKCFQSFENECQWNNDHFYILSSSNPVFHIQTSKNPRLALQLGMFDIFLFSLCEQHIISTDSGFGRLAAFASLKQRNIYSFLLTERHSCRNNGLPLTASAYHWSGI